MKIKCFQNFSWLYVLLIILLIIITTISIYINCTPIKKNDFTKIKVLLNTKNLKKVLIKNETSAFKVPKYTNYKFIIDSKNKPFIKNLIPNNTNYILYIEKKSYNNNFKNYNISNRNHFISKSIYVYGIKQNKNTILDLFEVMKFQKNYNKNYLKISLFFWLLFFSFFYLDRTLLKK